MSELMVEVTRGGIVESLHRGDIAIVGLAGRVRYALGDPGKVTFMRSSAKPVQALPIVESGAADRFGFTDAELAVMCASHNAEQNHVETVYRILDKIGLAEKHLSCGTHPPIHAPSAARLVREGRSPTAVHSNCSGKHAGMLALAVHLGFPLDGYFRPDHPVQRMMLGYVAEFAGVPRDEIAIGVDGCGVTVFALPLANMALAFARLANPEGFPHQRRSAVERITRAMRAHPDMVAGTDRFDTALMSRLPDRVVAKGGAEGVYCTGLINRGLGLALKVEDGTGRGVSPAVLEALRQVGALDDGALRDLARFHRPKNLNARGDVVGEIRPVFTLKAMEGAEQRGRGV